MSNITCTDNNLAKTLMRSLIKIRNKEEKVQESPNKLYEETREQKRNGIGKKRGREKATGREVREWRERGKQMKDLS